MLDSLGFMKSRPMTTFVSQALQNKETSSFFVVLCRYQSIPMPRDFPSFLFFFPLVIKLIYIGIKPGIFFSVVFLSLVSMMINMKVQISMRLKWSLWKGNGTILQVLKRVDLLLRIVKTTNHSPYQLLSQWSHQPTSCQTRLTAQLTFAWPAKTINN